MITPKGTGAAISAGLLAGAFGLAGWAVGGKYTLDGWIIGLNMLMGHLHIPARVPLPADWWVVIFVPLAAGYSWVELRARPDRPQWVALDRWIVAALLWALVILSDVGSTFVGTQNPGPRPWPITTWLATTPWAGGIWSIILTFAPEALMVYAWRLLRLEGGTRLGKTQR
jgi:hypothetical protein